MSPTKHASLFLCAALVACGGGDESPAAPDPPDEPEPVVEEVPLPQIIGADLHEDLDPAPGVIEINLFAQYGPAELEPGSVTDVMAYNGSVPGKLIHGRVGDLLKVHFFNQLAEETTVHWHGLRISDQMDGNPRVQNPVQPGEGFEYEFVLPDAGTYWYHPHANTVQQVERGLQGTIIVRADDEPEFSNERIIVLDDIRLDNDFQIAPFAASGPDIVHGRSGNRLLTNGSTLPLSGTLPSGAIERWRMVNSANMRTMSMSLEGASWRVIATDGGLLPEPYVTDRIELTVGHRFDAEVRVTAAPGSVVRLISNVMTVNAQNELEEIAVPVAEYVVEGDILADEPIYPAVTLPTIVDAEVREIALGGYNEGGKLVFTINGKHGDELDAEHWTFPKNQPMRLLLKNEIMPYHPFHLHGQFFQVLTRNGQPAVEPGLKDTVLVNAFDEVEVLTYFDNPGEWMFHCHIGAHAEGGMMSHLHVND